MRVAAVAWVWEREEGEGGGGGEVEGQERRAWQAVGS